MTGLRSALLLLAILTTRPVFAQVDVTGDWDVIFTAEQADNPSLERLEGTNVKARVTLRQDGDKLSGVYRSPQGTYQFAGGVIRGNDLRFLFSISMRGLDFKMMLTGKVDGDTITGKAYLGGFAEEDWTAKRASTTEAPSDPDSDTTAASTSTSAGPSGKWDIVLKMPNGDMPATVTLRAVKDQLSGTFTSALGELPLSGTADGRRLRIVIVGLTAKGDLTILMTGDLDGDTIVNGQADVAGVGRTEWTARRAK